MNILQFFFGIFKECFNVLNVDVFHLGFTWLEFLLAGAIIIIIFKFIYSIVGVVNGIDVGILSSQLKMQTNMKNNAREKQLSSNKNSYVSSDFVDVWGDGTYIVSKKDYYKR